jgi:hypothetical protein
MLSVEAQALVVGGTLSAIAAVAHLACVFIGAPAYRFLGAGERMARQVEAGRIRPTLITLAITAVLLAWALYGFSGAGIIGPLPLLRPVLGAISIAFLARAFAFPLLRPVFPENSNTFWLVSSGICLLLGSLYAFGAVFAGAAA